MGPDFFQIPVPSKSVLMLIKDTVLQCGLCLLASAPAIVVGIVVLFTRVLVVQLSKKKTKPNSGHALLPRRRISRHRGWSTHSSWINMVVIMNPVGRAKAVIPMRGGTISV
ncbi:hypothetical protein N7501_011579 [Penicillium viridicatum]|nr:hypothetical protein N7501_011579 [Penicillium viridicatum]